MGDDNIPAALLTGRQREILRGETDVGARAERGARSRVRDRLRQTMVDCVTVLESDVMQLKDLRQAIETRDGDQPPLWAPIAVLYAGSPHPTELRTLGESLPLGTALSDEERRASWLEMHIDQGVGQAIVERDGRVVNSVDTSIDIDVGDDLDALAAEDLAALPRAHLDQLLQAGKIGADEYGQAVKERFDRIEAGETDDLAFRPSRDPDGE